MEGLHPCFFYDWLNRYTATNTSLRPEEPLVWDQGIVDQLKELEYKFS
jgi:hypothetical protein